MKTRLLIVLVLVCVASGGWILFTSYDNRFPFGRMWETPGIRAHEEPVNTYMALDRIPWEGGEAEYRNVPGEMLISPVSSADPEVVKRGRTLYGTYCMQCHGEHQDGRGTVGQSFAPLPGDLRSEAVQSMTDGLLFQEISYGIPGGRQPALASTISVEERWLIIAFVKSLDTL
jgi:mono/diheme cytochrome c family protein